MQLGAESASRFKKFRDGVRGKLLSRRRCVLPNKIGNSGDLVVGTRGGEQMVALPGSPTKSAMSDGRKMKKGGTPGCRQFKVRKECQQTKTNLLPVVRV